MFHSASSSICKNPPGRKVKFSWRGDSSCQAVLCVTPSDTLALVLSHDVVVEITLNKHIRICRIGGVAATICSGGRVAAVHHPSVEIVQQETQIQMTSLCMCISMSGTVALCCFFAPKVYIAVCQPYKNVRMRQSAVGHLVNQQMRFMSQIATTEVPNSILSTSVVDCSSYPHFVSCSIVEGLQQKRIL